MENIPGKKPIYKETLCFEQNILLTCTLNLYLAIEKKIFNIFNNCNYVVEFKNWILLFVAQLWAFYQTHCHALFLPPHSCPVFIQLNQNVFSFT